MGKLLVHLTHGPEAPTRAALAFLVAWSAVEEGHDVTMASCRRQRSASPRGRRRFVARSRHRRPTRARRCGHRGGGAYLRLGDVEQGTRTRCRRCAVSCRDGDSESACPAGLRGGQGLDLLAAPSLTTRSTVTLRSPTRLQGNSDSRAGTRRSATAETDRSTCASGDSPTEPRSTAMQA